MTEEKDFSIDARIPSPLVKEENWGIVPYALYKYQGALGLSNAEVHFLAWVIMHRWSYDDSFPSLNALSRYTGKSRGYIQRVARGLKRKGLIEIKERHHLESNARASNFYDIEPLIEKWEELIKSDKRSSYNRKKAEERVGNAVSARGASTSNGSPQ